MFIPLIEKGSRELAWLGGGAQKAQFRHSLDDTFQSKCRNSLRVRKSMLQITVDESTVNSVATHLEAAVMVIQSSLVCRPLIIDRRSPGAIPGIPSSRCPSLPFFLGKASKGHMGSRRSRLRRQSYGASMEVPDLAASTSLRPTPMSNRSAELLKFPIAAVLCLAARNMLRRTPDVPVHVYSGLVGVVS